MDSIGHDDDITRFHEVIENSNVATLQQQR